MTTPLPINAVVNSAAPEQAPENAAGLRAAASRADALRGATPEAFVKFEAMVLQTFMQSILPKDSETVYGGGMAGDMWKSLLARQLGAVMAERGGIGIADRILGDHYRPQGKNALATEISRGPDEAEPARQDLLSTAMVEKMQRDILKSLTQNLPAAAAAGHP